MKLESHSFSYFDRLLKVKALISITQRISEASLPFLLPNLIQSSEALLRVSSFSDNGHSPLSSLTGNVRQLWGYNSSLAPTRMLLESECILQNSYHKIKSTMWLYLEMGTFGWSHSKILRVEFSRLGFCCCSVGKSCPTLCNPVDCSMPGFPVLHYLSEFAQTHVHWVDDAIKPSHSMSPSSPPVLNLSQHQGLFQWVSSSSGSHSIRASASASVLPMNIQGGFPLGLTGLISLLSKGLSRVFSSTTIQKYQFFNAQPFLWFNLDRVLKSRDITFPTKVL